MIPEKEIPNDSHLTDSRNQGHLMHANPSSVEFCCLARRESLFEMKTEVVFDLELNLSKLKLTGNPKRPNQII